MRQLRDEGPQQELLLITAAAPLNLAGELPRHDREPRVACNRVAYLDGTAIAVLYGGNTEIPPPARHFKFQISNSKSVPPARHFKSEIRNFKSSSCQLPTYYCPHIHRTSHRQPCFVHAVEVKHVQANVLMSQQFLNRTNRDSSFNPTPKARRFLKIPPR